MVPGIRSQKRAWNVHAKSARFRKLSTSPARVLCITRVSAANDVRERTSPKPNQTKEPITRSMRRTPTCTCATSTININCCHLNNEQITIHQYKGRRQYTASAAAHTSQLKVGANLRSIYATLKATLAPSILWKCSHAAHSCITTYGAHTVQGPAAWPQVVLS